MNAPHNRRKRMPRRVTDIAASDRDGIGRILRQARDLDALDHLLQPLLPKDLAAAVHVANLKGNRLVLTVDSGAVAARIRMESERLIAGLNRNMTTPVKAIDIRIAPPARDTTRARRRRSLSEEARQALQAMREQLSDSKDS